MIAQRFRPVVWVVGCSFAATALYTVSLGVASERSRLEDLDHSIAMTRRDIRQLQTEMGTRASLRQLERWNGEVLALSAPTAGQFRATEAALRTIDGSALPADGFIVSCFPHKIRGASAGWTRAVAIFDEAIRKAMKAG